MDLPPASHPDPLRAHLLGSVRLAVGNRVIPDHAWPRRGARALLLLLLATPGHRISRDRVLDFLWPDTTHDAALRALRVALHALRRVLEPDLRAGRESAYVESRGHAVALRSGVALWVDVHIFEAALARVDSAALPDRPSLLRETLALYGAICSQTSPTLTGRQTDVNACGEAGGGRCSTSLIFNWDNVPSSRSPSWSNC